MTLSHFGPAAISLYITEEELNQRNFTREALGPQEAYALLAQVLQEQSCDPWQKAEIEVYPGCDSILLFARRPSEKMRHFFFDDFEDLITLAALLPTTPDACLNRVEGGYLLSLSLFSEEAPPAILFEFAQERATSGPYLVAHLKEQGACLIAQDAIGQLKTYFSSPKE